MASNREYDQDPDVTIGIRLPIDENWTPSESTMSAAEFNIQNLLKTKYGEMKYNNGEKFKIMIISKDNYIYIKGLLNYINLEGN